MSPSQSKQELEIFLGLVHYLQEIRTRLIQSHNVPSATCSSSISSDDTLLSTQTINRWNRDLFYQPGKDIAVVDALSRNHLSATEHSDAEINCEILALNTNVTPGDLDEVCRLTTEEPDLQILKKCVLT
ncbi:unnamed protein product [Clavelina lepadiformis]|uniref:Uncharacterized protein n=1 Tax=Clavelina lepadiformis TaxID=159417 RepID=A0ABP0GXG8_CLALP